MDSPQAGPSPSATAYRIERAQPHHVPLLPAIEVAAATLLPIDDLPEPLRNDPCEIEEFAAGQRAGTLWVALAADATPVAFALVRRVDGGAHLEELDVHPDHGRRGIGRRLVERVLAQAREQGETGVTLTTFSHVPYNAPFYRRLGFRLLDATQQGPELAAILANEDRIGLRRRVAMRCPLTKESPR